MAAHLRCDDLLLLIDDQRITAGSNPTNGCGSSATHDSCWRLTDEPSVWPSTQDPA
jgi:hypothetical protein